MHMLFIPRDIEISNNNNNHSSRKHLYSNSYVPDIVLRFSHMLVHIIFAMILGSGYCFYFAHLLYEETSTERLSHLPKWLIVELIFRFRLRGLGSGPLHYAAPLE